MKSNTAVGNAMILKAKALLGISLESQDHKEKARAHAHKTKSSTLLKRTKSSEFLPRDNQPRTHEEQLKSNLDNFPPSLRQKREVLNDAALIWQQKLSKLQRRLDKRESEYLLLCQKYKSLEGTKNDLQNALALHSAQIIKIRRLEAKEDFLNKNLAFFKNNVTLLLDTLMSLKDYHIDTEG